MTLLLLIDFIQKRKASRIVITPCGPILVGFAWSSGNGKHHKSSPLFFFIVAKRFPFFTSGNMVLRAPEIYPQQTLFRNECYGISMTVPVDKA